MYMPRKMWVIVAALFFTTLLMVAAFLLFVRPNTNADVTLVEAKQEVLEQYKGTIVSAELNGSSYLVRLKSDTGLYEFDVDKDNSEIIGIKSIERYEVGNGDISQPSSSAVPDKDPADNPAVLLTEVEAAKLASDKVDGTVTEIDIKKIQESWYYFVELDTQDGREADIQIHAASGAIASVTWDDDDDNADDDDDK